MFKDKIFWSCLGLSAGLHIIFSLAISLSPRTSLYLKKTAAIKSPRLKLIPKMVHSAEAPDYTKIDPSVNLVDIICFSTPMSTNLKEEALEAAYIKTWDNTKEDIFIDKGLSTKFTALEELLKLLSARAVMLEDNLTKDTELNTFKKTAELNNEINTQIILDHRGYKFRPASKLKARLETVTKEVLNLKGKLFITKHGLIKSVFIEKGSGNHQTDEIIAKYLKTGKITADKKITKSWLTFSFLCN